ncbi:RNA polymerase sigma-70 factor (ECF subfamily) [Umezawaea tangerina]|uniref:RNA polymerase sigma-70 factor (ECF subfamily) n=1 Tax=Umezawaea tangerina TaxID=84725 RepID=A0A2T0TA01_9PSEU|nr:RNA polymerase sigma-70 factor (ECF subfamily) [Umezawaea tangerina]
MGGLLEEPREPGVDLSPLAELAVHDVADYLAPDVDEQRRLNTDVQIHQHFRENGVSGAVSERLFHQLLGYGLGFVTALVRSGAIFAAARKRGWAVKQQVVPHFEVDELVSDVVLDGFGMFCDIGVEKGGWSPHDGGLPLKVYYINACLLSFPNRYRKWQRGRRDWEGLELMEAWSTVDRLFTERSAEDVVVAHAVVDSLFKHMGENDKALLALVQDGYTAAEIGDILRIKTHAAEVRISRARATARRYLNRDGGL